MILFGFFLAVAVLTAVQAATSIKGSCRDFAIDDAGLFSALCDGGKTRTAMDLNKCLVNKNSFLKFRKESVTSRSPPPTVSSAASSQEAGLYGRYLCQYRKDAC